MLEFGLVFVELFNEGKEFFNIGGVFFSLLVCFRKAVVVGVG